MQNKPAAMKIWEFNHSNIILASTFWSMAQVSRYQQLTNACSPKIVSDSRSDLEINIPSS